MSSSEAYEITHSESFKKTSKKKGYMLGGGEKICVRPVVVLPVSAEQI